MVSISSQLGGLQNQTREPGSNGISNNSSVYHNTVHATRLIKDLNISSETSSTDIQQDVIKLLGSSDDNKFADAIGIGSLCNVPK